MPQTHRCPRCETPAQAGVCPSCGYSSADGDATWFLEPAGTTDGASDLSIVDGSDENPQAQTAPRRRAKKPRKAKTKAKEARARTIRKKPAKKAAAKRKPNEKKTAKKKPSKKKTAGKKQSKSRSRGPAKPTTEVDELSATNVSDHRASGTDASADPGDDAIAAADARYELLGEIGKGGMGVVFKAYDRELDEVIALKSLVDNMRSDPGRIARFKNEIRLARKLSHPNIARVHDLVELHGRLCLSMAYIEGRSLDKVIKAEGRLETNLVIKYLRALVPALALAHDNGIVHRDIKPGNIIVDAEHTPHIVDFGIAASGSKGGTARVGTPSYMAPECWLVGNPGIVVDARADLYALGISLYEMVCGHVPFASRDLGILMKLHCERAPRRPQALVPGVPDVLDAIIMRLLEKEPGDRHQHAREILDDLDAGRRAVARMKERPKGEVPPIFQPPGARGKILLASGDAKERSELADQVRDHDFFVVDATDGVDAVGKAFQELPDLVVLDSDLQTLDVLNVIRILVKDERTRNVPIVVLSSRDEPDFEALARDVGAASYFVKPLPKSVLDLLIGRYFG